MNRRLQLACGRFLESLMKCQMISAIGVSSASLEELPFRSSELVGIREDQQMCSPSQTGSFCPQHCSNSGVGSKRSLPEKLKTQVLPLMSSPEPFPDPCHSIGHSTRSTCFKVISRTFPRERQQVTDKNDTQQEIHMFFFNAY